jgi:hypothetical protein
MLPAPAGPVSCAGRPGPDHIAPAALLALPNFTLATRLDDLSAAQVVLATAAK